MINSSTLLETNQLSKYYASIKANDDVNLTIQEGQIHAIIGPNGAGKTTLVNLLAGDLKPTSGTILFQGQVINELDNRQRCHLGIARSYQINNVFPGLSVIENVMLAAQARVGIFGRG